MKNYKEIFYKIKKNQFLSDIEPFKSYGIPTNIFLYKVLPGLGATESELVFERNSIIVESNVPVIIGKCKNPKHKNKVLGIYEGVTVYIR